MSNTKTLSVNKLIEAVSRKGGLPATQNLFQEADFLAFINEEIDLGVVPHILMFHEDYFLFTELIPIVYGQNRYTIPNRAIGNKLRDVSYFSGSSTYEMTRVSVEDMSDYSMNFTSTNLKAFYIEGDEIVIPQQMNVGSLSVSYYIRPNSLVSENNVCTVTNVNRSNGIVSVDKYPENFVNVNIFDITSSVSSFRLVAKEITPDDVATSSNLKYTFGIAQKVQYTLPLFSLITPSSYIQVVDNSQNTNIKNVFWFDTTGSDIAPVIANANLYKVLISSALNNNDIILALTSIFNSAFSTNALIMTQLNANNFTIQNGGLGISVGDNFSTTASFTLLQSILVQGVVTIPAKLRVDDVISLPEETIIPQIPIELHPMLAQRVVMRCLESLGDTAGLQLAGAKLADMEAKTGSLIDNRVESSPMKIVPRHTPIKNAIKNTFRRS